MARFFTFLKGFSRASGKAWGACLFHVAIRCAVTDGYDMANTNLSNAKSAKNDEFCTQYADIQKEVNAYLDYDDQ